MVGALQDLVDREIWRVPCRLEAKPSFHIEDDTAAAHLYRIAREAVINANKHAQARQIVVRQERTRKGIALSIADNGVGIRESVHHPKGMGFHIMNERANSARRTLEAQCAKQGGT